MVRKLMVFSVFAKRYCLQFLFESDADEVHHCREFRLGMMSPFRHPRLGWENNAAAATIAINKARSEGLLEGHTIKILWRNDRCSSSGGTGAAVELKEEDIDVYIGPPCSASTTSAGLLAAYWNIPMFSQASSDPALANKVVYNTLVRLGPPFNKLGNALVEIFQYFNWNRVMLISRRKTDNKKVFCDYSSRSVDIAIRSTNITLAEWIQIGDDISSNSIEKMLDRIQQRSRIIILCTENKKDKLNILERAVLRGMMDGSYVFFIPDHLPPDDVLTPWDSAIDTQRKKGFLHVFQMTVAEMAGPEVEAFRDEVVMEMSNQPFNYSYALESGMRGSPYSPFLHDIVYFYLLLLNETLTEGGDTRNGTFMFNKAHGKKFGGITGNVQLDSNGDRNPDYWIWDLAPGEDAFKVVMEIQMTSTKDKRILIIRDIVWGTENGLPPPDTPPCGFNDEHCISDNIYVIVVVITLLSLIGVAMIPTIFFLRRRKMQARQMWKIPFHEITCIKGNGVGSISQLSLASEHFTNRDDHLSNREKTDVNEAQVFSYLARYKETVVSIHCLTINRLHITKADEIELTTMRELSHLNIASFIGICLDERLPCMISIYCSKGSLQDIIENEEIKLNLMFEMSLLADMINGLNYIHSSPLKYHGNLKSSNCVVDNRWILKLTDFGGVRLRREYKNVPYTQFQYFSSLFWTAPENISTTHCKSSKKGDIYSLGIILFELIYRTQPYDTCTNSPEEIIGFVKLKTCNPPYRPDIAKQERQCSQDSNLNQLKALVTACWDEDQEKRATIANIRQVLKRMNNGRKINIVDDVITKLEHYANNLEEIIQARTGALIEEKQKTDRLLYNMLPLFIIGGNRLKQEKIITLPQLSQMRQSGVRSVTEELSIAEILKKGEIVVPEVYNSVTIFFSDIVGFTALSTECTAIEVVDLLNDLYTNFDSIISTHDVYKVETIGDAYMVVSGLPVRNGDIHVCEIANMALELRGFMRIFRMRNKPEKHFELRIGLHTGPCAAGVVGRTMPRYCLFGDTVNTASRMESNGSSMMIHISQQTYDHLSRFEGYTTARRGEIEMKGKGIQTTYWLNGKLNYSSPRPNGKSDYNSPSKVQFSSGERFL